MSSPAGPPGVHDAPPATLHSSSLRFTGSGAEYFRIWIVNTLLTLLTLGVYSAWAKVRKTRYFWQNTQLDGFAFDYHARPWPILRGRVLALVLLGAYSWAFDFSRFAGLVMVCALCTVGPWLFMKAQQFKLTNTSWRGLRFGFDADLRQAYRRLLPVLLLWFSSTLVGALFATHTALVLLVSASAVLLFPWMHHRLKAYPHDCASRGDRRFSFAATTRGFYKTYLLGIGLMLLVAIPLSLLAGAATAVLAARGMVGNAYAFIVAALTGLLGYVTAGPYLAARLQRHVWAATRLGEVGFRTVIKAWPLARLTLRNVLFTVLTGGLYWPFAAVAFARYRIECMHVDSGEALDHVAAGAGARSADATGDGALDALGLDIGL